MEIIDNNNPNYRMIKNFLNKEQIDYINKDINKTSEDIWGIEFDKNCQREDWMRDEDWDSVYAWKGTSLNIGDDELFPLYNLNRDFYYNIGELAKSHIQERFNVEVEYESIRLNRWKIGRSQDPHLDYLIDEEDNDLPGETEDMKKDWAEFAKKNLTPKHFATLIYLNDNFEGGDLYFSQYDNGTIRPETGMMVGFKGDTHHLHGVTEITKGTRYTISIFWRKIK